MSRYVEVNKAMDLCTEFFFSEETCSVESLFNSAPSIDIVRCGECKYWRAYETWSVCELWTGDPYEAATTKADDFCSYGERKEKTE